MATVMKLATVAVIVAGLLASPNVGNAQSTHATVLDGDVYLQDAHGLTRLTQGGRNSAATTSRDGSLLAFVHFEGQQGMTSLYICIVAAGQCQKLVSPHENNDPKLNLTNITAPLFSYQASAGRDGKLIGSIFFMADAWATSAAIHRVTLGPNPTVTFVTDSNALGIMPNGKFAGALIVSQHIYASAGGSCDQARVFDPNTKKVLQNIPTSDCQALHIQ